MNWLLSAYCQIFLFTNKHMSSYDGMFIKTKSISIKTKAIWQRFECGEEYIFRI